MKSRSHSRFIPKHRNVELLESRRLFSTLTISGTGAGDTISLQIDGSEYAYSVNGGTPSRMALSAVTSIAINGLGGNDTIHVESLQHPATISGGSGDDTIAFAPTTQRIENIAEIASVDGGTGANSIRFHDDFNFSFSNTHVLTAASYSATSSATVSFANATDIRLFCGQDTGTINVNNTPANSTVYVRPNRHSDVININETAANSQVVIDPTNNTGTPDTLNVNADGAGAAVVQFEQSQLLAGLNIGSGGRVRMTAGGGKVLQTVNLSITGTGALDLADNAMIHTYSGSSPIAAFQSLITAGHAGGTWTGNGITSSVAATQPTHALGYADATEIYTTFPATFQGVSVTEKSILIRYTRKGDADLNGTVNLADFNRLSSNFGLSAARWSQGNFDFDSDVDLNDFNQLAGNFGQAALE